MTYNPTPPPSGEGMMKRLSHKNGERLEKRRICLCISFVWYSCVWLFFFLFFFVPRNIAGYIASICPFLLLRAPLPPLPTFPHTENKTKEWTVSLFVFFFALTVFRKRTGGGGFLLPVQHRGFLVIFLFLGGGQGWQRKWY